MLFGDVVKHKNPMIWNIHNKKLIQEQNSFFNKVKDSTDSNIQKCLSFQFQIVYFGKVQKTWHLQVSTAEKKYIFFKRPNSPPKQAIFFELSKVLTAFNVPKVWTFEHSTFQSSKKHVFFVFEFLVFSKVPNNMFWFLNFEFSKVKTKIRIQWSKFPIIWTFAKTRTKQRYFLNSRIFTGHMSSSTFPSMLQMLNIHKVTYDFLIIFSFFFLYFYFANFPWNLAHFREHEGPNTFHFLSPSSGNLIFRMNMPWISKVRTRQRNRVHPQGDQPVKHLESILRQELSAPESLRRRHAIQASSGSLVLVFCFVRSTWALSAGWSEHPDSLSCSFVCVSTMFCISNHLKIPKCTVCSLSWQLVSRFRHSFEQSFLFIAIFALLYFQWRFKWQRFTSNMEPSGEAFSWFTPIVDLAFKRDQAKLTKQANCGCEKQAYPGYPASCFNVRQRRNSFMILEVLNLSIEDRGSRLNCKNSVGH